MPSPEEFGDINNSHHGVNKPPTLADGSVDMALLKQRARQIREAQAKGIPFSPMGLPEVYQQQSVDNFVQVSSATIIKTNKDEELEQVRVRFKLANYYEALLEQPAFGDDTYTDPYAAQVHSELTEWVKGRMSELVGIRNNPEGFLDEEIKILRSLAQNLNPNGVKAIIFLVDRILNPPQVQPKPAINPPSVVLTQTKIINSEDSGDNYSDTFLSPEPVVTPTEPVQVATRQPRAPRVRRAKVPGSSTIQMNDSYSEKTKPIKEPISAPKKLRIDPLAAGKAAMSNLAAPVLQNSTTAIPVDSNRPVPVPMPHGRALGMAMAQKAEDVIRLGKSIEATGF